LFSSGLPHHPRRSPGGCRLRLINARGGTGRYPENGTITPEPLQMPFKTIAVFIEPTSPGEARVT